MRGGTRTQCHWPHLSVSSSSCLQGNQWQREAGRGVLYLPHSSGKGREGEGREREREEREGEGREREREEREGEGREREREEREGEGLLHFTTNIGYRHTDEETHLCVCIQYLKVNHTILDTDSVRHTDVSSPPLPLSSRK